MHDIDRGAKTTAVRLAALAALRKAHSDGMSWDADAENGAGQSGSRHAAARAGRSPGDAQPSMAPAMQPVLTQDSSSSVFAAVEAAVRRSRVEFVTRLAEYRKTLDCDRFEAVGSEPPDARMDEVQFIAHRIAGVGKTLGFEDLGDAARQTEAAITAYKLERSQDLRTTLISRICALAGLIEGICAENQDCLA